MSSELWIPPHRDLPPGRLAVRTQHLRAEIARKQAAQPARQLRVAALVALVLALATALLATPAFGLRDRIAHLFAAERSEPKPPPALIRRFFKNMYDARPDDATGVIPARARVAIRLSIPGFGHKTLWVAPTRAGGYCSNIGCNRTRRPRFEATMEIAGPTSTTQLLPGSGNQHVFFLGDTTIRAARLEIRFEDGGMERRPLVWVSNPIDAGFFLYLLPKSHWKPGERPVALALEDARGHELARDTRVAGYFAEAQLHGLAPAPKGLSRLWLIVPLAAAIVAAAALLAWRRRWFVR